MRADREGKQNVKSYLDETRPKRQDFVMKTVFLLFFCFFVFMFVQNYNNEEANQQVYAESETASKNVGQNQCSLPKVYPYQEHQSNWENLLTHCKIIEEVTDKYQGIEPELVAAIIMVESDGDFKKLSKVGAVGLMQVMPSDGYSGDTWGFNDRPITYDLFNPETNVREGVRILNDAINTWGDLWNGLYHYVGLDSNYPNKVIDIYEYLKNN